MSLTEHLKHVEGKKLGDITLYALSTCGWCRKTKGLLNDLNIDYRYVDVDLLGDADQDEALKAIRQWNEACSFPTMVVNNNRCIIGFNEAEIRGLKAHAG